jgi:hypothetical protein
MLSFAFFIVILNVVILSGVILSVVAPTRPYLSLGSEHPILPYPSQLYPNLDFTNPVLQVD